MVLNGGHKTKWRQVGPGKVQLGLPVMAGAQKAFLCEAYVKANANVDQRKMARLYGRPALSVRAASRFPRFLMVARTTAQEVAVSMCTALRRLQDGRRA